MCEGKFAAAKVPAVVIQPEAWIEVPGIKYRHPIAVLKPGCPHEDHASKIGEN
jgi:hypothetical protein